MAKTVSVEVKRELTKEAVDIVYLLSMGFRPKDIGDRLQISNRTAEAKIDALRGQFQCSTPAHLVGVFMRNKLIE